MIPAVSGQGHLGAGGGGNGGGGSDPDYASVICLLNANNAGTAGVDESPVIHTVGTVGTPTFISPGRKRAYAIEGKSSGNRLEIDPGASYRQLNPGPVDLTIEGWFRLKSSPRAGGHWIFGNNGTTNLWWRIYLNSNKHLGWGRVNSFSEPAGQSSLADGVWHHFALVVDGGGATRRLYRDGVQLASESNGSSVLGNTSATERWYTNFTASDSQDCDSEDLRITRGVARYPSGTTFTPPVDAFPTS